jgi:hypothetical protein
LIIFSLTTRADYKPLPDFATYGRHLSRTDSRRDGMPLGHRQKVYHLFLE